MVDTIKDAFSMKVNNRVFARLYPRRQLFIFATYDAGDEWRDYAVKTDDDLASVKTIAKSAMEKWIR